jgi:hypothetical protein
VKKLILIFSLSSIFYSSTSHAELKARYFPTNVCVSLLTLTRDKYVKGLDDSYGERDASNYLRKFRLEQLDSPVVLPSGKIVTIPFGKKISLKEKQALASRLRGIEVSQNSSSEKADQKIWTFIKKMEEPDEIRAFNGQLEDNLTDASQMMTRSGTAKFSEAKRLFEAIAGTMAATAFANFFYLGGHVLHTDILQYIWPLAFLAVHLEPLSMVNYHFKEDSFFKSMIQTSESFLAATATGALSPGDFSFDSHTYALRKESVMASLVGSERELELALNQQNYRDTRGIWSRYILENLLILVRAKEQLLREVPAGSIAQTHQDRLTYYIHYDRLLTVDIETHKPVEVISVRVSSDRGFAFVTSKQNQNVAGRVLMPIRVESNR